MSSWRYWPSTKGRGQLRNPVTAIFGDASSARYFKGECAPVCIGKVPCNMRQVRRTA
jgi:hypothetical protein